jgi:uncharacterized protein DUF5681
MAKKADKPENSANAKGKQSKDHLWKKGQSGNPSGKKPGTRHKATQLAETLLDGQTEELVKKCVEMALEGDGTAMKICLDRLIPPRKDRPVSIDLPLIEKISDASKAMATVSQAVADGSITPLEGQTVSGMLEHYRKTVETVELEQRITELEKRGNKK